MCVEGGEDECGGGGNVARSHHLGALRDWVRRLDRLQPAGTPTGSRGSKRQLSVCIAIRSQQPLAPAAGHSQTSVGSFSQRSETKFPAACGGQGGPGRCWPPSTVGWSPSSPHFLPCFHLPPIPGRTNGFFPAHPHPLPVDAAFWCVRGVCACAACWDALRVGLGTQWGGWLQRCNRRRPRQPSSEGHCQRGRARCSSRTHIFCDVLELVQNVSFGVEQQQGQRRERKGHSAADAAAKSAAKPGAVSAAVSAEETGTAAGTAAAVSDATNASHASDGYLMMLLQYLLK
jgi:hypothetical protein